MFFQVPSGGEIKSEKVRFDWVMRTSENFAKTTMKGSICQALDAAFLQFTRKGVFDDAKMFKTIDKNGNGSLSKNEFLYAHRNILPQPGPRAPRGRPDRRPGLGSDAPRTQPRENDR